MWPNIWVAGLLSLPFWWGWLLKTNEILHNAELPACFPPLPLSETQHTQMIWLLSTGLFTHSCPRIYGPDNFSLQKNAADYNLCHFRPPPPSCYCPPLFHSTHSPQWTFSPAGKKINCSVSDQTIAPCMWGAIVLFPLKYYRGERKKKGVQFDIGRGGFKCCSVISRHHLNRFWYSAVKNLSNSIDFTPWRPTPTPPPPPPSPVFDLFK